MKTRRTILYGTQNLFCAFAVILALALALATTACDDGSTGHTHDYGTAWKSNATQHWHECSCGDKTDVANHIGDPCSVCSYSWTWTAVADSTIWEYQYTFDYDDETFTSMVKADINAIAYGNNKWVAVGDSGKIAYSADGASWTAIADSTFPATYTSYSYTLTYSINGIAYGGGRFVAVGDNGKIAYSDNGVNWTAVADSTFGSSSLLDSINAIAYGNGRFVAGGGEGKMAYSDDGENWTAVGGLWSTYAIAYGNGRWVAGDYSGDMAYSDDGENWTAVTDSTFDLLEGINGIAYGNNKWVAVGDEGKMATSSDGITWTAVADNKFPATYTIGDDDDTFTFSYSINAAAYGNAGVAGGRFVAVGEQGKMAYSDNGVNWTAVVDITVWERTYSDGSKATSGINGIAYGNGRFVAVSENGKMAYTDF